MCMCVHVELVFGVRVKVCGDLMKLKGPCLLIMNHRTRLDWMYFWCYLIRMGQLPLLKIMLKASLKKVPVAGKSYNRENRVWTKHVIFFW